MNDIVNQVQEIDSKKEKAEAKLLQSIEKNAARLNRVDATQQKRLVSIANEAGFDSLEFDDSEIYRMYRNAVSEKYPERTRKIDEARSGTLLAINEQLAQLEASIELGNNLLPEISERYGSDDHRTIELRNKTNVAIGIAQCLVAAKNVCSVVPR